MSSVDGVPHDFHGRQVGLGTLFASALYERIFRIESPDCSSLAPDIDKAFWGPIAESIDKQYQAKKATLETMRRKLTDGGTWQNFLSACRPKIRPPVQIKSCLRTAGAAHTIADIGCSRERLLAAALHMQEIRSRPTVIDLALAVGILPEATEEIVDEWLTT
jgi:glycerol dehydrogenase-like iron-containing ADH family enzyme